MKRRSTLSRRIGRLAAATAAGLALAPATFASSHSDAPLIKLDPQANLTDVYAFIGMRGEQKVLNVIVNVHPFCEPGDGGQYDKFSDDALYSIHIAHPTTGATLVRYDFQFSSANSGYKNNSTILSYGLGTEVGSIEHNGDNRQNYTQRYSVTRVAGGSRGVIGTGLLTPPPNVGLRTTPYYNDAVTGKAVSGATDFAGLDRYTQEAIHDLAHGETVFAGSREDSFYADPPGIFDLLNPRILDNNGDLGDGLGQDGGGVDGFKGYNVMTYALQIPVSDLPSIGYTAPFWGASTGVGVYASVSRPRITLRSSAGDLASGPWIQVNRLGNPLFNEALVALKDKDKFNRTPPTIDASTFSTYAENPELALLINFVYGTAFAATGRTDLVAVYIPDVVRVHTGTDAVRQPGQAGFSRFGFAGGDTATDGGAPTSISSGWPNGRRLGDDVIDIALTAVASGPSYATLTVVGDNVAANDQVYHQVFPYAATPNSGTNNSKDP